MSEHRLSPGQLLTIAGVAAVVAYLSLSYLLVSRRIVPALDLIVFTITVFVGATLLPGAVAMRFVQATNGVKIAVSRLYFLLGQMAYGGAFLVQLDDGWTIRPAREVDPYSLESGGREYRVAYEVHVDSEWRPVLDSANVSVLGWQPFGLLRYKTGQSMAYARPRGGQQDGAITRGNAVQAPATVTDDGLLIDVKQVWGRGLDRIADTGLIEKTEEIEMREQSKDGAVDSNPLIGAAIGLVLGVIVGIVVLGVPVG